MDHATTVEEVVRRFYSGGGNDSHYLLLQYQASREAWSFVWPLLESSKVIIILKLTILDN